ncbi:MAG: hypothetical protein OES32_09790 [Acidobacteriota bacterium]|nr:hypothetical protein [Acidobacteriota bacterium]
MAFDSQSRTLFVAEIPYESGQIRFRYARYLAPDGAKWVRHGLFVAYHRDGTIASEGEYVHGLEQGLWSSYHENGTLAARGHYADGVETGTWQYWNDQGDPEASERHEADSPRGSE